MVVQGLGKIKKRGITCKCWHIVGPDHRREHSSYWKEFGGYAAHSYTLFTKNRKHLGGRIMFPKLIRMLERSYAGMCKKKLTENYNDDI